MASLTTDKNGNRVIQFFDRNRKRQTIRLGTDVSLKQAGRIKLKIENLIAASKSGDRLSIDDETAKWTRDIGDDLAAKLAKAGLIEPRAKAEAGAHTLDAFCVAYIEMRVAPDKDGKASIGPATRIGFEQIRQRLMAHFGKDRRLSSITLGDCDEWVVFLRSKYAAATVAKTIKRARQIFKAALRKKLIAENPLTEIPAGSEENRERMHYIDRATAGKVLAAAPDAEWKAIFAACRFGGLRCPSELAELKWEDIDFKREYVLKVRSPKLRRSSKYTRTVPIFDELYPYFAALYDDACERHDFEDPELWKGEKVFPRAQHGKNLATQMARIIVKGARITPMIPPKNPDDPKDIGQPWPRLFQNLRSSRETELIADPENLFRPEDRPSIMQVCEWLGNSPVVAAKHYLQATREGTRKMTGKARAAAGAAMGSDTQRMERNSETVKGKQDATKTAQNRSKALGDKVFSGPGGTRTHTPFGTGS